MGRGLAIVLLLLAAARAQEVDDPVANALAQLQSDTVKERVRAARALGKLGGSNATAGLRRALEDKEELVRVIAATALIKLKEGDAALVEVLTPLLQSKDWYTRWQACLSLGAMGATAKAAVPALINAAHDAKLDVSQEAAQALARIAPDDAAVHDAFIDLLSSGLKVDHAFLIRQLEKAKHADRALPALEKEFLENKHRLREQAFRLMLAQGKKATPILVKGLGSADRETRVLAAEGLVRLKDPSTASALIRALDDEEPDVRAAAARALGVIKAKDAVDELITTLALDKNLHVRQAAVGACAAIGNDAKRAGPSIVRLFRSVDPELEKPVREALRAIGYDSLEWFLDAEWIEKPLEKSHWRVSFATSPDEDAATYVDGLKTELDENVHGPAMVDSLKVVLDKSNDAALVAMSVDKSDTMREAAAYLLGVVAHDKAVAKKALEKATLDVRAPVRDAAKASLKKLAAK